MMRKTDNYKKTGILKVTQNLRWLLLSKFFSRLNRRVAKNLKFPNKMKEKCCNAREIFRERGFDIKVNNTVRCHNPHSALTSWRTLCAKWSRPGSSYYENLISIFCLHVISLRGSSIVVVTRLNLKLTTL